MDKNKLQKIIAKEGLIVLGLIVITRIVVRPYRSWGRSSATHDHFLSSVILVLFIYGAIRFAIWAIRILDLKSKLNPKLKKIFSPIKRILNSIGYVIIKYEKNILGEFKIIGITFIVIFILAYTWTLFPLPNSGFDLSNAMSINKEDKVEVIESNKKNIEELLGKSISGIPEQQVQLEVENKINSNMRRDKLAHTLFPIFRLLGILALAFYPVSCIIRFILWLIKRKNKEKK